MINYEIGTKYGNKVNTAYSTTQYVSQKYT